MFQSVLLSETGVHVVSVHTSDLNVFIMIIVIALIAVSLVRIILHEFELRYHSILPESALVIVLGAIFGAILLLVEALAGSLPEQLSTVTTFNPESFFIFLIPPILLEAGYFLHKSVFFHDLDLILLYAVVGTILNTFITGSLLYVCGLADIFVHELPYIDALLFSSLISAVDPVAVIAIFEEMHVNEQLYILVFGESVLNDAVSVVLFNVLLAIVHVTITIEVPFLAVAKFFVVSIGGTLVGVIFGLACGLLTRFTGNLPLLEPLIVVLTGMLSFLTAEMLSLSGIVAIMFCAIVMSRYVEANIGRKSHSSLKYLLKIGASTADTLVFISLGISCLVEDKEWDYAFILLTITFILFSRFLVTFGLTFFANFYVHDKVSYKNQFVIAYGGLRGAIAYALSLIIPGTVEHYQVFQTTTLVTVLFTVFFMGTSIKPLLKLIGVKLSNPEPPHLSAKVLLRGCHFVADAVLKITGGHSGSMNWKHYWTMMDNKLQYIIVKGKASADTRKIFQMASSSSHKSMTLERRYSFEERDRRRPSAEFRVDEEENLVRMIHQSTIGGGLSHDGGTETKDDIGIAPLPVSRIQSMKRRRSIGDIMMQRNDIEQSHVRNFEMASIGANQRGLGGAHSRWFSKDAIHDDREDSERAHTNHWLPRLYSSRSKATSRRGTSRAPSVNTEDQRSNGEHEVEMASMKPQLKPVAPITMSGAKTVAADNNEEEQEKPGFFKRLFGGKEEAKKAAELAAKVIEEERSAREESERLELEEKERMQEELRRQDELAISSLSKKGKKKPKTSTP